MGKYTLQIKLSNTELQILMKKYHFAQEDFPLINGLHEALCSLLTAEAFYHVFKRREGDITEKKRRPGLLPGCFSFIEYDCFAACAVTLGAFMDDLQELYARAGRVSEEYILECIGMELLQKAYLLLAERIREEENLYIAGYDFFGDRYSLEQMKPVLDWMQREGRISVGCNEACVLQPQKSVLYLLELTQDAEKGCRDICSRCSKKQTSKCINRNRC